MTVLGSVKPEATPRPPLPDDAQDERLVRRARRGDAASREALARRWLGRAYGAALARVRSAVDAEDLVQEAFCRAFQKLASLRDPTRFGPWLLQIVRNGARDLHRRAGRATFVGDAVESLPGHGLASEGLPGAESTADEGGALAAWRALPDEQRLVCWLKVMDGVTFREIAALLGQSKSAVYRTYTQGLERLRRELTRC